MSQEQVVHNSRQGDMPTLPPMDLSPMKKRAVTSGPMGVARVVIGMFSGTGVRPPPSPIKKEHVRLITIANSHFCEKGRWAMDLVEQNDKIPVYYTEDAHPPGFVAFETLRASKGTASATPMTVLSSSQQSFLVKSDVILQEFCPELYPSEIKDAIMEYEIELGECLGATIRCFAYSKLLGRSKEFYPQARDYMILNTSNIEKIMFRAMFERGLAVGIIKGVGVTDERAEASLPEIRRVFQEASKRLESNGGEYLMDTKNQKYGFTAADLTFAALASPIVFPPCLEPLGLRQDDIVLPPALTDLSRELRATTAGQHALRMYAQHRPVASDGKVYIKSWRRNRLPWKGLFGLVASIGVVGLGIVTAQKTSTAES